MTLEPQGIWMCQLSRVSVQTEERSAGSRGPTLAKSAWQENSPVLDQVCFWRCLHTQRPQSTRHYLHLCSASNTLFNRTEGYMSLCLLFQITTEKAVSSSVPSSVRSFPKPCHSGYRQFHTFLKNTQASLESLLLLITWLLCSLSNSFFLNKTCKCAFLSVAIHFPCTSLYSPPK